MYLRCPGTRVRPSSEPEEMSDGELLTQGQWQGYASCAPSGGEVTRHSKWPCWPRLRLGARRGVRGRIRGNPLPFRGGGPQFSVPAGEEDRQSPYFKYGRGANQMRHLPSRLDVWYRSE